MKRIVGLKLEIKLKYARMETLENFSLQDITEMWNRCWRGYYYDMTYSEDHMKVWLDLSKVSLQNSIAILDKRRVVGFVLLAVEKRDGWIAGACIDPDYRRQGLFSMLLKSQLNLANYNHLQRIYLEVLEQNHARNIYQSIGFKRMRQLNVYRAPTKTTFERQRLIVNPHIQTSLEKYFKLRYSASFNPAWQRRESYLKRYTNIWALINQAGTAGALFAGDKSGLLLDLWSLNLTGAEELIPTILRSVGKSLMLINQPNDWVFSYLLNHGILPSAKQIEMCIDLS